MKHLWEVEHDYYCTEESYFGYGSGNHRDYLDSYKSWPEFLKEYSDSDLDMNLVFRWDWSPISYKDKMMEVPDWSDDWNYRDGELTIFWMMQRKGYHRSTTIQVCKNDEPSIIKWLRPRFNHLIKLWSPLQIQSHQPDAGKTT